MPKRAAAAIGTVDMPGWSTCNGGQMAPEDGVIVAEIAGQIQAKQYAAGLATLEAHHAISVHADLQSILWICCRAQKEQWWQVHLRTPHAFLPHLHCLSKLYRSVVLQVNEMRCTQQTCCMSLSCGVAQVLQLEPGSDAKSIKTAVRKLARKVHPDKCSLPGAAEAFKAVVEAAEHVSISDTGLWASQTPNA